MNGKQLHWALFAEIFKDCGNYLFAKLNLSLSCFLKVTYYGIFNDKPQLLALMMSGRQDYGE